MKTADCPEIRAAAAFLDEVVALGYLPAGMVGSHRVSGFKTLAEIIADARNAILEAMLDNGCWQIRYECSLCQCDDLPLVFCSGPYGITLRCSDCSTHLRYTPIPEWGDYCGGTK